MENISVAQAATLAGVGKSTVRRAIKKGDLLGSITDGPNGEQFEISLSSFETWMASRGAPAVHQTQSPGTAVVPHQGEQAWDAVVESQQTVQKALEALEKSHNENIKMVRQMAHLEGKLESKQLLLSANNESISKQEAKIDELRSSKDKAVKELERHNKEQEDRFEKEKAELLEKLNIAESQAQKFERLPKWVRGMFGT